MRLLLFIPLASALLLNALALRVSGSGSSGTSNDANTSPKDEQAYLDAHNTVRTQYYANPLVWNATLADAAQEWADQCIFEHSDYSMGPYGENLVSLHFDEWAIG
jgi:uncharacterized protein YkwD